jgi:hypothetical protein
MVFFSLYALNANANGMVNHAGAIKLIITRKTTVTHILFALEWVNHAGAMIKLPV